jgi:hypothetical protein
MQSTQNEMQRLRDSHLARFESDPVARQISGKIWFGEINDAPLRYFTNKTFVSEPEKEMLERLDDINKQNGREIEDFFRRHGPHGLQILEAHRSATFSLFVRLYEGKVSYGDFHVARREITARSREALIEREREIAQRLRDDQTRATNNFVNFLVAQQLVDALRQPTYVMPQNVNLNVNSPPPVQFSPLPAPGIIRR